MSDQHDNLGATAAPSTPTDTRRRRFLGVGASATPAILTLASQPALGVTCFTPSRSLSRNTSLSQGPYIGECSGAESPGNYKQHAALNGPAYHWPTMVPPDTPFHPTFAGTSYMVAKHPGPGTRSLTMLEVLNLSPNGSPGDPEKVAFHLVGAYLNLMGGNGAVISPNAMTLERLNAIWIEWSTTGRYQVMAGVYWNGQQIKDYLLNNGIVA